MTAVHVRQQLRAAVAQLLVGLPLTQSRVFPGRAHPVSVDEIPCFCLATPNETSEVDAIGDDPPLARTVQMAIIGYAEGTDIEDVLDQLALDAETAIAADTTLGGLALGCDLTATAKRVDGEAKKRAGEIVLTYQILYRTPRSAPQTATP
jgi:hypothetical protein